MPHYLNLNTHTQLEAPTPGQTMDYDAVALAAELVARGHGPLVEIGAQTSGLAIIQVGRSAIGDKLLIGGADPRRDGVIGGR
ncbi:hypothetical protein [Geoalkalibacter halelectricus]|uniref:Uncharacterized protein n=1 Tax=Geoalkalibacter halelectricus TaxID=2847045 RepID=A0ABY5ZID0_9BACT|nr:hypothetical protein [Geoalkalibacter halelectricus]MDO3380221.1 hypothetical protein [Geoalkalibacter halelectricus]UWZ78209.1 hypothetical protein L9S41_10910 [Geoalkalibacter halelectricus]